MDSKRAFTIIELVMVLAVVAFAVSLFAPLLIKARAAARVNECANNLRRLGLAWQDHEQALGYYPSSGWGWRWTGDPDRGFGKTQPGGWCYDALRFTEYADIVTQGAGKQDTEKGTAMLRAHGTPIPLLYCPERRPATTYPVVRNGDLANNLRECRAGSCRVVRTDYQANSGNIAAGETGGPSGGRQSDLVPNQYTITNGWNGVTFHVSETRSAQVTDGLSHTICVAEKYLNSDQYLNGLSPADCNSAFAGLDRDVNGYTASATRTDNPQLIAEYLPRRDKHGLGLNWTFGSAHPSAINALYCDMSVRSIFYGIDYVAYWKLGGRNDEP